MNIAGYFDPAVRKQLAMLAVEHDTDQVKLMAEALNLLFEKYGRSPIASA
ncbi:ribbon-helix-helix domain-containing protein [Chromobacterium piscinae]